MTISVHNSANELSQQKELVSRLGISQFEFPCTGRVLPYAQKIVNPECSGAPVMIVFLHGIGSVGHDNFLQLRIPAERLIRYCGKRKEKFILLFPQCEEGFQWVDVPWSETAHRMPETPSVYMKMLLALLEVKLQEFHPAKLLGIGVSMGGFGIWDLGCRSPRPFDGLAVLCGGADTAQAFRFCNSRIYMIHGTRDSAVPVCRSRDMAAALQQTGCRHLHFDELPEATHDVWETFFNSMQGVDFLLEV